MGPVDSELESILLPSWHLPRVLGRALAGIKVLSMVPKA